VRVRPRGSAACKEVYPPSFTVREECAQGWCNAACSEGKVKYAAQQQTQRGSVAVRAAGVAQAGRQKVSSGRG